MNTKLLKKDANTVLLKPHITEKATTGSVNNMYTFIVDKSSNKKDISDAIFNVYKVRPIKISVINVKGKASHIRGSKARGAKASFKKAVIFLSKGDKIENS